jgi:hypothetical protein
MLFQAAQPWTSFFLFPTALAVYKKYSNEKLLRVAALESPVALLSTEGNVE